MISHKTHSRYCTNDFKTKQGHPSHFSTKTFDKTQLFTSPGREVEAPRGAFILPLLGTHSQKRRFSRNPHQAHTPDIHTCSVRTQIPPPPSPAKPTARWTHGRRISRRLVYSTLSFQQTAVEGLTGWTRGKGKKKKPKRRERKNEERGWNGRTTAFHPCRFNRVTTHPSLHPPH